MIVLAHQLYRRCNLNIESNKVSNDTRVAVSDLEVGMFVTKLDRDWLDTPFLMQGFYIKTHEDIDRVAQYCHHVWVLGTATPFLLEKVDFKSGELIGRKPAEYAIERPVRHEYREVMTLIKSAGNFTKNMLSDARLGHSLDTAKARDVVDQCVNSIIRHPDALSWMVRMRNEDEYTAEHCLNVCILSLVFGRKLGLRKQQLNNLGLCGLLHDIGKMKVPPGILNKPGPHDAQEREIMRAHTTAGKELLTAKRGMYEGAIDVAQNHHEREDGAGYPRGISGENLSLFNKIVSIVDAYDAITGNRVYARGRPSSEALRIIYENKGRQFDSKLALAFIQTIGLYPPGSIVELVNGYIGLVFESDNVYRHLPKVMLLLDGNKRSCEQKVVDLTLTESGKLSKDYFISHILPDGSYGIYLKSCFEQGLLSGEH